MAKYETHFIPQNKAPDNNNYIYVYDGADLIGKVKNGSLKTPALGKKLYSFGALSDVHISDSTKERFQKALACLNDRENVSFTCIAGDLTNEGTESQLQAFGNYLNKYSPDTPVYAVTGNHDLQSGASDAPLDFMKPYTGQDLYYTFTQGDDVFIMFGMSGWYSYTKSETFSDAALNWLYEVLEANRNKRCFLFTHPPRFDGSGKPYEPAPTGDLLTGTTGAVFKSLTGHYKNMVYFHGHTHMSFECQKDVSYANYDKMHGCHSVHIPSLAAVKTLDSTGTGYDVDSTKGMGYVVDVYENHIVLRGRDFANNKFVPIATYCLDTTLQNVAVATFKDITGT